MIIKKKRLLIRIKKAYIDIIQIGCGTLVMAMGVALFLVPNKLSTGGFSGISTIFYHLFNVPVGTTMLMLNVPLFITTDFIVPSYS